MTLDLNEEKLIEGVQTALSLLTQPLGMVSKRKSTHRAEVKGENIKDHMEGVIKAAAANPFPMCGKEA